MAKAVVDLASDKKAIDILLLDIRAVSIIADYFVICTGESTRQIQAIAASIEDTLGSSHGKAHVSEEEASSGWVLLDYGDIIIHIFNPQQRDFYNLERLWSDAATRVYLQ